DVRKDALYCDAPSSTRRKAAIEVVRHLFETIVTWLAPMLPFTTEEAWLDRHPDAVSVHLAQFPSVPAEWRDDALAEACRQVRQVRCGVTAALEIERKAKTIGSSLEPAPVVHITDPGLFAAVASRNMADICITSDIVITGDPAPAGAFALDDVKGVAVVFAR